MTEPGATARPTGSDAVRLRLYVACLVAMAVFAASVVTLGICLPEIRDEFRLSLAGGGLLGSLRTAALLPALLLSGYLADRFGKSGFLTTGMLLVAAGLVGTSLAGRYGVLLATQTVAGMGAGVMEALVNPLVAELYVESPARPLNVANGLFSVGLVVASIVCGEMLQAHYAWRTTFWVWAPAAGVGAVLFATRGYPGDARRAIARREGASGGMAFLRKPLFWVLMGAMVLAGGCEAGMTFWGASFVKDELRASARGGAWTVAVFGACMAAGRFTSGGLVSRVPPLRLMTASAAGCALATAGLCFKATVHGAPVFFALGGLLVACFWPTILAVAAEKVQVGSATMFALLAAAGISGCTAFPWCMGRIGDVAGLRAGAGLLPCSMFVAVVLFLAAWRMTASRADGSSGAQGARNGPPEDSADHPT
jgi:fucose permease